VGEWLGLDRPAVYRGLRLALAALLAFAIASLLHVGNAYWAAMPVWVVSQSARGLLLERGFFRVAGTLAGAAAGFAIIQLDSLPYLVLALLGAWVWFNASLVQLLRGVHGYGAMMAGMTAAVVVLPSVFHPEHAAQIAIARVDCTLIGVIVVTAVTGFWTPAAQRAEFYQQVRHLARDVTGFVAVRLAAPERTDQGAPEPRILLEMVRLQAKATLVTAGSVEGYRRLHHVDALIVATLGVLSAGRALTRRARRGVVEPNGLGPLVTAAIEPEGAQALARIEAVDAALALALRRLVAAEAALEAAPDTADARSFGRKAIYLAPHHDKRLAIESGAIAGMAAFAASALAHVSGWAAGDLAALGVCIFSMVLGSLPAPKTIAPVMLRGVTAGVAAALVYRLCVQPYVTTVPGLILSVAPFILVGGLGRVSRKTEMPALDANMCFMLASQAVLPAVTDHAVIFNGAAALMLAAGLVTSGFMLLSPRPDRRVARTARAIGTDLLRIVQAGPVDPDQRQAVAVRQMLRLSVDLERASALLPGSSGSPVALLNLGEAIEALRALRERPEVRALADAALRTLRDLVKDPSGTADRLDAAADTAPDGDVATSLRDIAVALRESRSLLVHG
jgi:uncharacterized membrane protein YccC